jgi:hypothetical protein
MATKAIVDAAMKGDIYPQQSSFTPNTSIAMPYVGQQQFVVFKLVRKVRRMTIDGICHYVINPKTGNPETIRLINGAGSIWSSDLTELLKDKAYISKNRIGLQFLDGVCRIGVHEKTKLEFARMNANNVGKVRNGAGKFDYYEYDAAEEQKMANEETVNRLNLLTTIATMEEEKMVRLALYMNIKTTDDIGIPRNPQGYRTELMLMADKRPKDVLKYMNSKEVDVSYMIRKGLIEGKIDLGGATGNVTWAAGGGFIGKIPKSRQALEYLTELAMTNSNEGIRFKEQLEKMIT